MRWKKMAVLCIAAVLNGCGIAEEENLPGEPMEQAAEEVAVEETDLYGQFLQGDLSAVIGEGYPPNHTYGFYSTYLLGARETYTLEEMEREVADAYLHPKWSAAVYDSEAACSGIQYAYVESADGGGKNLLLRFDFEARELNNLYKNVYDAPIYVVVALAVQDEQLSIIDQYDNGTVFETTAYENGLLYTFWKSDTVTGSAAHALLSNGKCERLYEREKLSGEGINVWKWESRSGDDIYEEVLASEQEFLDNGHFSVRITTVYGDDSGGDYYQYNMDECTEQDKKVCESFLNRCREEASVTWMTEEEVQSAVAARYKELGISFEDMSEPAEVVWKKL